MNGRRVRAAAPSGRTLTALAVIPGCRRYASCSRHARCHRCTPEVTSGVKAQNGDPGRHQLHG